MSEQPVASLDDIKRAEDLHWIETPWGRMGLRKGMSLDALLMAEGTVSKDGTPKVPLPELAQRFVQAFVGAPELDAEAVRLMAKKDGAAVMKIFGEITALNGWSAAEQKEMKDTFHEGVSVAGEVPPGG